MLRDYLAQIRVLLADPTSNLVAAAMGVSIAVIFVVLIALILLFFALSPGPRKRRRAAAARARQPGRLTPEQLERRRQRRRLARRVWWTTILGGVIASWVALYVGTSANLYCANTCHAMLGPAEQWRKSPHRNVACVRCHEGAPLQAFVTGSVSRARSLYYQLAERDAAGTQVPSTRCLSCHAAILERAVTTQRAVKVSHAEPIEAGAACSDCHRAQGHAKGTLSAGMPACLPCHDGVRASAACETCHPKGIEAGLSTQIRTIGSAVRLPEKPTCDGCHPQDTCDACHGLRMPHPDDYDRPQRHARPAAFDGKLTLCYRCHAPTDCLACHRDLTSPHGPDWKRLHSTKYDRSHGNGYCLWCHRTPDFCGICH